MAAGHGPQTFLYATFSADIFLYRSIGFAASNIIEIFVGSVHVEVQTLTVSTDTPRAEGWEIGDEVSPKEPYDTEANLGQNGGWTPVAAGHRTFGELFHDRDGFCATRCHIERDIKR